MLSKLSSKMEALGYDPLIIDGGEAPFCISLGMSTCLRVIEVLNAALLADVEKADIYLALAVVLLTLLAIAQKLDAFTRPPPVPTKLLPHRPVLQVNFKPDDADAVSANALTGLIFPKKTVGAGDESMGRSQDYDDGVSMFSDEEGGSTTWESMRSGFLKSTIQSTPNSSTKSPTAGVPPPPPKRRAHRSNKNAASHDLPDSFAPLLSSSEMEVVTSGLTSDLIHAVSVQARLRFREGRHVIPLDKDNRRPQFFFDSSSSDSADDNKSSGCMLSLKTTVGSERFSLEQDLDTTQPTTSRSRPLVKGAELIFDPPLRLGNVAPTLLHFPDLFEDRALPKLRRMRVVGIVIEFLSSLWFLLEKILWAIERRCQVHLSKVNATPTYRSSVDGAHWRLHMAFTGHLQLFGWVPVPFISLTLPSFIIPHPHALLEYLISRQPLASARIKRENISEERITVAALDAVESWSATVKAVATPPALEMDMTMPGGITLSFEVMHGRDVQRNHPLHPPTMVTGMPRAISNDSLKSPTDSFQRRANFSSGRVSPTTVLPANIFNSNSLTPWYFEVSVDGSLRNDKLVFNVNRCLGRQNDVRTSSMSALSLSGSAIVSRAKAGATAPGHRRTPSRTLITRPLPAVTALEVPPPSVHALLMFPETIGQSGPSNHLLEYDYVFDVGEETNIDAVSLSYGASHPMLKGGTIVSCILESMYAYGTIASREGSVLDPSEALRKRNILKHLPAVDFTAGIQNAFVERNSLSYIDDGHTRSIPEMEGGRFMFRIVGGLDDSMLAKPDPSIVKEGIKFISNFGVSSFAMNSETCVNEFPELDIFEDSKLISTITGTFDGSVTCHLRPQNIRESTSSSAPNVFNPLEAYELDFSGSSVSLRLKEATFNLDHRRVIVPTETTFGVRVNRSIVNMMFEGTTHAVIAWDFQGSSPVLQVSKVGYNPVRVSHEDRAQVHLLIKDLCQGRLCLDVSSVGGLKFKEAATLREDRDGLYNWKFFNSIVSPDEDSPARILDVMHDKKTMHKLLAVVKLVNEDLERALKYILTKVWRAKEIFDQEGISDPGMVIPGYRMARLASLFLCGDLSQVDDILPIIQRVNDGDGLDVLRAKDLLRKHIEAYDEWAAELDRAVKWAALMLGGVSIQQPIEAFETPPLCECLDESVYEGIPTARQLYQIIQDKPKLPLAKSLSSLVSRLSPYMTLQQVSYVLHLRPCSHWQPFDLKRLRYVYSIKKKVDEIKESYGGLSFMPQSFFVSIFLGEATRSSLRAASARNDCEAGNMDAAAPLPASLPRQTAISALREKRFGQSIRATPTEFENFIMSPAGRIASLADIPSLAQNRTLDVLQDTSRVEEMLGDSLLGPRDVAILIQAGLASAVKGSTVVQLNQRMLLDLMASQPSSFAVAVLAELGADGPRALVSAMMALCDLEQSSFKEEHRIDMHNLLESWLPGLKIPKRDDYRAGGRWARQSYYDAVYAVSVSILDLSQTYIGLKLRIQRVRLNSESDPLPLPLEKTVDFDDNPSKFAAAVRLAQSKIAVADELGTEVIVGLREHTKSSKDCEAVVSAYQDAFEACARVLSLDRLAFQTEWFKAFYRRNYDALMVKSVYENVINDVDSVRTWMEAMRRGAMRMNNPASSDSTSSSHRPDSVTEAVSCEEGDENINFMCPEEYHEQNLVDSILDSIFFDEAERRKIRSDPLARLLISNKKGKYNFTLVTAMGVITEGKKGTELQTAIQRLEKERGVVTIRSDTGTARSIDYNAERIEEAVCQAVELKKPYGLVGYSQGCANGLNFESLMLSGTPDQKELLTSSECGLVCRQLLFSAANGSVHGPATESKVHNLITMFEDFFKYQQGYFSHAFISSTLEVLNGVLDSAAFQKFMGGAKSFLPEDMKSFWRETQHLPHIPTCVLRGVHEDHTTPESLEMLCNLLTKQSGSALHDSQVHVYDAVGYPVYVRNRNGRLLKSTDMGGAIQRTHHWSPLAEEVEFVRTQRDVQRGAFDCAKDRHIFPFCDVNARFGIIQYTESENSEED